MRISFGLAGSRCLTTAGLCFCVCVSLSLSSPLCVCACVCVMRGWNFEGFQQKVSWKVSQTSPPLTLSLSLSPGLSGSLALPFTRRYCWMMARYHTNTRTRAHAHRQRLTLAFASTFDMLPQNLAWMRMHAHARTGDGTVVRAHLSDGGTVHVRVFH